MTMMIGAPTDAALWAEAKHGRLSCFGRVFRRTAPEVRAYVLEEYGASAPVDDIVLAAFLAVWRARPSLDRHEVLATPVLNRVPAVVESMAGHFIRRRVPAHAEVESRFPTSDAVIARVDPGEAALLYFGAGLSMDAVTSALLTSPAGVIEALRAYQAETARSEGAGMRDARHPVGSSSAAENACSRENPVARVTHEPTGGTRRDSH